MVALWIGGWVTGVSASETGTKNPDRVQMSDVNRNYGVNVQASYLCAGNMNLAWTLMQQNPHIKCVRIMVDPGGNADTSDFVRWITEANNNGYQVIVACNYYQDIGSGNPETLLKAADWWKTHFTALSAGGSFILNLMNEWGNHSVTATEYAAAYNSALAVIRGFYAGPVICDIPGWGQETHVAADASSLITDGNIIFSVHIYPCGYNEKMGHWLQTADLDYLAGAGQPVVVGEFGNMPTEQAGKVCEADWSGLVDHAKSLGWGVLGWAWNGDGDGEGGKGQMNMITPYWGDTDGCNATSYSKTSYFDTVYEKLHPADIVVEETTFDGGVDAQYKASHSIIVGPGVAVEPGARLTLEAPVVKFVSEISEGLNSVGFHAQRGASVHVGQSVTRNDDR